MDAVEQKILAAVDASVKRCLPLHRISGAHAEPGFFETRTAARVAELLRGCGLSPANRSGPHRRKGRFAGGAPGPCAAVIGELDGHSLPRAPRRKSRKRRCPCLRAQCAAHRAGGRRAGAERARGGRGAFGQRGVFCRSRRGICPHRHAAGAAKAGRGILLRQIRTAAHGRLRRRGPCADHACTYDSLRK